MDKLPWFKFLPTDWIMGKIQRCPEVTQARFMRLICLYWNKECILTLEDAEIEIDKEHLDILIGKKIIKLVDNFISIEFLNEQLESISETSQKRRDAVLLRWARVKQNDTSVSVIDTSVLQNDTEKRREEEIREDNIILDKNKPEISEFILFAKTEKPLIDEYSVKAKYDAWVSNGWKDGNNKKIVNWKIKLRNTLPYLKENNTKNEKNEQLRQLSTIARTSNPNV